MDFQSMIDRAITIRKLYEEKETQGYGSPWTKQEIALGFVGDVGDLAKLILAENGKRNIANSKEELEHELSDCLWSVIVLAHLHDVSLEAAFVNTMHDLQKQLMEEQ